MKKGTLLVTVLVVSIVGSILAGCSSAPEGDANAQASTSTATQGSNSKKLGKMDAHLGTE